MVIESCHTPNILYYEHYSIRLTDRVSFMSYFDVSWYHNPFPYLPQSYNLDVS